jgi:hypothetical protein
MQRTMITYIPALFADTIGRLVPVSLMIVHVDVAVIPDVLEGFLVRARSVRAACVLRALNIRHFLAH